MVAHHFGAVGRHVAYGDAAGRGRLHVDVVHAGAGLADDPGGRQGGDHLGRETAVGGDDPVGTGRMGDDLVGGAVAAVAEARELNARRLHHGPLKVAVVEIEVHHRNGCHGPSLPQVR